MSYNSYRSMTVAMQLSISSNLNTNSVSIYKYIMPRVKNPDLKSYNYKYDCYQNNIFLFEK